MIDVIDLEPGYRVAVSYDYDGGECPAEWLGSCAVVYDCGGTYNRHGRKYCHNAADAAWIADAVAYYDFEDAPENIAAAIARHYTRAGWSCTCRKVYPGNPYDVYTEFIAVAPGYGPADGLACEVDRWRNGEVYCLELQALRDGEWYTLDYLYGVYGDQLEDVARDMARGVVESAPCAA